jgi:hypothetical protein
VSLPRTNERILKAWDSRPEGQKFKLVCMAHHANQLLEKNLEAALRPWALRGALTFMSLSPQSVVFTQ